MPTYEYACTACGQHVEVYQRLADDALTKCEACGGALRKVFHPAGIVFKGSGFYATDSRSGSKSTSSGASAPSTSSTPSESGSDAGGASGSKGEAPSDTASKGGEKAAAAPAPATEAAK